MSCNMFSVWPLADGRWDSGHVTEPEPLQWRPRQYGCRPTALCQNQAPLTAVTETWPKPRWPKTKPGRTSFLRQFRRRRRSRNSVGLSLQKHTRTFARQRHELKRCAAKLTATTFASREQVKQIGVKHRTTTTLCHRQTKNIYRHLTASSLKADIWLSRSKQRKMTTLITVESQYCTRVILKRN